MTPDKPLTAPAADGHNGHPTGRPDVAALDASFLQAGGQRADPGQRPGRVSSRNHSGAVKHRRAEEVQHDRRPPYVDKNSFTSSPLVSFGGYAFGGYRLEPGSRFSAGRLGKVADAGQGETRTWLAPGMSGLESEPSARPAPPRPPPAHCGQCLGIDASAYHARLFSSMQELGPGRFRGWIPPPESGPGRHAAIGTSTTVRSGNSNEAERTAVLRPEPDRAARTRRVRCYLPPSRRGAGLSIALAYEPRADETAQSMVLDSGAQRRASYPAMAPGASWSWSRRRCNARAMS
jgi:hypothetical protein